MYVCDLIVPQPNMSTYKLQTQDKRETEQVRPC